tara:strand:- start:2945 stop:4210 length:1266 start_codon:yes stop_codon:yes gene_type:complete
MKKIIIALFLNFIACSLLYAESYHFNKCKLTDILYADYSIDLDKKIINVTLEVADGTFQTFSDPIELIEKDKITSKKIKSSKSEDIFFVYYLDVKSKSVVKQNYKIESGIGLIRPYGEAKKSFCENVSANWDIKKIELAEGKKDEELIKQLQEEILREESSAIECKGNDYSAWTNCIGNKTDKNGFKYIGNFKNGKIIKGTIIYPGNSKYSGDLKNEKPHGQGTFIFSDGSKHYGQWKNGKGEGDGTKTWKDGGKYSGKFKNDKPNGKGTFIYPDGSSYAGEWVDGKRHGQGTLTYSDGRVYIGQFVDGLEHGEGTCFNKDGSSINCKMDIRSTGRNTHDIAIDGKKWIKISEFEASIGKAKKTIDMLENEFDKKAYEFCSETKKFSILKKGILIIEYDETPAIGLEPVVKLGIDGVIECK